MLSAPRRFITLLLYVAVAAYAGCRPPSSNGTRTGAPRSEAAAENVPGGPTTKASFEPPLPQPAESFIYFIVNPRTDSVALFWKDGDGKVLGSLGALKRHAERGGSTLRFAMNGGMYMEDQAPLGLFIEAGKERRRLNRATGYGNFYLKPNGVLFLTKDRRAGLCRTEDFPKQKGVQWATQSGPMLLIDGTLHPKFTEGSANVNIRNGVGILPDGRVLAAISAVPVSFWDFAMFFKNRGCRNALYLDGAVSRMWCPEAGLRDSGGAFGVMIGVTER